MSENSSEICSFLDRLPTEVQEIIFDKLSVSDLLNLCSVCQRFEDLIGKSHKCMSRVWIKFYSFKLKDIDSLAMSARHYEKLKVNRVKESSHFAFLANLEQRWRKVLIYNCEFKHLEAFVCLMQAMSDSIEELEISDIEILNQSYENSSEKFPNLKRVMFRNVPSTAIEMFLGFNKSLENISLDIVQPIEGKISLSELTHRFLKNSEKLNHLQLGPHFIKALFDQEEVDLDFSFRLKRLLLKFPLVRDSSPPIATNISRFLKLQSEITWIIFFEIQNDQVLTSAWNSKLSRVTFIGLEELFDEMDIIIEPNVNIKQIDLMCRKILISQLRKLLKAAPCLTVLHVQTLTRYVMEFAARNHPNLRTIRYENIEMDVSDLYEQLKAAEEVNKSIEFKKVSFWFEESSSLSNPFLVDPSFWHI